MDLKHELIAEIKQMASDLGRTPTRNEWLDKSAYGRHQLELNFGTYAVAIQAAGLIPASHKRVKISGPELFGRDLPETLAAHEPKTRAAQPVTEPILIIGDAHFPFVHLPTLEKIYAFARKHRPKHIVQTGDLYDFFAHSKFPRSQNYYSPDQEMTEGRNGAEKFWSTLGGACPDAKRYQLLGNHDVRPLKRIMEAAPTLETFIVRALKPFFEFQGVQTIEDPRMELVIQGVSMIHGYSSTPGHVRDLILGDSVVSHTHKGGTIFRALKDRTIAELNPGFVGDETSKALSYTAQKTTGWTLGWGWWDEYGPRFIPG